MTVSFGIAFALIAVVKFVLAQRGLLRSERRLSARRDGRQRGGQRGAALTAIAFPGLYALAYWGHFWLGYGVSCHGADVEASGERRIPTAVGYLVIAVGIKLGAAVFLGADRRERTPPVPGVRVLLVGGHRDAVVALSSLPA